jgi:hypothetical protein
MSREWEYQLDHYPRKRRGWKVTRDDGFLGGRSVRWYRTEEKARAAIDRALKVDRERLAAEEHTVVFKAKASDWRRE